MYLYPTLLPLYTRAIIPYGLQKNCKKKDCFLAILSLFPTPLSSHTRAPSYHTNSKN